MNKVMIASGALVLLGLSSCAKVPPQPTSPGPSGPPGAAGPAGGPVQEGDAPEISRSRGEEGGFVILWPRIVPKSDDPQTLEIAELVQGRLRALVTEAYAGRPVDLRPEPERVCPKSGCVASSVGAIVTRKGDGCVVLAWAAPHGESPATILPWAGQVDLVDTQASFRDPPESNVRVMEYVPCGEVVDALAEKEKEIVEGIGRATGE